MFDIVSLGELLIDYIECGRTEQGMKLFSQNPGGAVSNVLCAAARLGLRTAFVGKVGDDPQGRFLQSVLEAEGVDTDGLIKTAEAPTTMAFVTRSAEGERAFTFVRKPGADTCLRTEELRRAALSDTRVLHVGSLSLTDEPARSATRYAIHLAKAHGAWIAYDPNYRALLWKDAGTAAAQMRSILGEVDLLKISEEETELLSGFADPESAIAALLRQGPSCIAVTQGRGGVMIGAKDALVQVPGFPCRAVDTTGAGDAFWGGFLYSLLTAADHANPFCRDSLRDCGRFANAVAACCVQETGALTALPTLPRVMEFLETHPAI